MVVIVDFSVSNGAFSLTPVMIDLKTKLERVTTAKKGTKVDTD